MLSDKPSYSSWEFYPPDIKYASGVLAAARFPLARLRSAGGFKLRREFGLMTKKDC